jgi:hypothetical protein
MWRKKGQRLSIEHEIMQGPWQRSNNIVEIGAAEKIQNVQGNVYGIWPLFDSEVPVHVRNIVSGMTTYSCI